MTRWLVVSALLTVAAFAGSFYVYHYQYDRLPEQVPIHWDWHGKPDGFKNKQDVFWVFLFVPATMAGFVLLMVVLPWLSPKPFDVDRFRGTFGYTMMLLVALFGYIHALTLWGSLRQANVFEMGRWLVAGFFVLFILMGNVLGRIRRNFWMGVRTPWTLASEKVWVQTHRVTAWLFVAGGVVGFVSVLAGVPVAWVFVGFMLLLVTVPVLYSLVLFKRLEKQEKL